ncbi:unnamed protein product [Gongylonema pulchrum]|uniref:Uncharacterized protein n=1 Tax=Gongylonema pulchrum TaxID=637853 RepID=A0A183EMX1_9BILA|nr:unnamed protein product [Gongylonema pulchrum]
MNRRIKTARAQLHLHHKRQKFSFTESIHATDRCSSRTSLATLKTLKERIQCLPSFAHQSMLDLMEAKHRNGSANRCTAKDTESSSCSVKSLNTLQLVDYGLTMSATSPFFPSRQPTPEIIEMQEGDLLL